MTTPKPTDAELLDEAAKERLPDPPFSVGVAIAGYSVQEMSRRDFKLGAEWAWANPRESAPTQKQSYGSLNESERELVDTFTKPLHAELEQCYAKIENQAKPATPGSSEFDELAVKEYSRAKMMQISPHTKWLKEPETLFQVAYRRGAKWQFNQDRVRIELYEELLKETVPWLESILEASGLSAVTEMVVIDIISRTNKALSKEAK